MLNRLTVAAVAPYLVWMVLLFALPQTAGAYAVRTAVTALSLGASVAIFWQWRCFSVRNLLAGIVVGLAVLALWVLPEKFQLYRDLFTYAAVPSGASPYDPAVCGWTLCAVRLAGSAFVIAPAEELFFRFFLYRRLQSVKWLAVPGRRFDLSAFAWTVSLFALEHDRWLAGALAGALYGMVSLRFSIFSAIVAHVLTNLLLGLIVIFAGAWAFW